MKNYIILNENIYRQYKDEVLSLNPRLFTDNYFYNLDTYETPFDLKGLENYLSYVEQIEIFVSFSFLDFTNLLLILSFLKEKKYQNDIIVSYLFTNKARLSEAKLTSTKLKLEDLKDVDEILLCLKNKQSIKNVSLKIPGFINYVNFFNILTNKEQFLEIIDEAMEDIEDNETTIAKYLADKYETMGLNEKFYQEYIKELEKEDV